MIRALRIVLVCLLASHAIIGAATVGIFYEEISESDGNTIIEESMQQTPIIHKSFHQCSIKEYCNYVIRNMTTGNFTLFNSEGDLPHNRTGLRIWKKIDHEIFNDCRDAYNRGSKKDGVFKIKVPSFGFSQVRCEMTTEPRGWIVFQRRVDAAVDFYRNWQDYKDGFGDLNGNFWLGLEKLHQLAAPGKGAILRVDLRHTDLGGAMSYAEYSLFEVSNELDGYRLKVGEYTGNTGDSLAYHNNMMFTTKDKDLDVAPGQCAHVFSGGFWFLDCYQAHPNGIYPPDNETNVKYISWHKMPTDNGRIVFCEMKIRLSVPTFEEIPLD